MVDPLGAIGDAIQDCRNITCAKSSVDFMNQPDIILRTIVPPLHWLASDLGCKSDRVAISPFANPIWMIGFPPFIVRGGTTNRLTQTTVCERNCS